MGNSAVAHAVHVVTMFLQPGLLDPSTVLPRLKGARLIGAPYHFHLGGAPDVLTQYCRDADAQAKAKVLTALLRQILLQSYRRFSSSYRRRSFLTLRFPATNS